MESMELDMLKAIDTISRESDICPAGAHSAFEKLGKERFIQLVQRKEFEMIKREIEFTMRDLYASAFFYCDFGEFEKRLARYKDAPQKLLEAANKYKDMKSTVRAFMSKEFDAKMGETGD